MNDSIIHRLCNKLWVGTWDSAQTLYFRQDSLFNVNLHFKSRDASTFKIVFEKIYNGKSKNVLIQYNDKGHISYDYLIGLSDTELDLMSKANGQTVVYHCSDK